MRFVTGLMLGMALGTSLGLLDAPQRGSETIRVIRERLQQRGETDPDEDDLAGV
jgi:gas vesicle protein